MSLGVPGITLEYIVKGDFQVIQSRNLFIPKRWRSPRVARNQRVTWVTFSPSQKRSQKRRIARGEIELLLLLLLGISASSDSANG